MSIFVMARKHGALTSRNQRSIEWPRFPEAIGEGSSNAGQLASLNRMTSSLPSCIFKRRHTMGITTSKKKQIKAYCETHGVKSLYLFGSRARGDDTRTSDFDLLIEFKDGSHISYLDMMIMKSELESILGSGIDLVEGASVVNPIRRSRILRERTPLYGA